MSVFLLSLDSTDLDLIKTLRNRSNKAVELSVTEIRMGSNIVFFKELKFNDTVACYCKQVYRKMGTVLCATVLCATDFLRQQ